MKTALLAAAMASGGSAPAFGDAPEAAIRDIREQADERQIQVLVALSEQPTAAAVTIRPGGLDLALSGVSLRPFETVSPYQGHIRSAAAKGGADTVIHIEGPAPTTAHTTLYRRSVLITATLPAPVEGPAADPPSVAETTAPGSAEELSLLSAIRVSQADCDAAEAAQAKDAWDMDSLGVHLLCLTASGDASAAELAERLAQFAPMNWRGLLAQAELTIATGDIAAARTQYDAAMENCDNPMRRAAIASRASRRLAGLS